MRKKNIFSALLSLFLLVPASITWAQTISSQKGLTTAVFTTSSGNIKVYLPDDIRPGDLISGRVIAEPIGKNAKQTANNLAELKKYSISFNNEKFAVDNTTKQFQFLVNADRPMKGQIELINGSGKKAGELSIPTLPEKSQQPAPAQCKIPPQALTGSPFRITGPFDGNSSNTNCMLDNKPMEILVKSPRECIVLYPADATGIKTLKMQESGKQICSQPVSGVQMNVAAGKLNLLKGEQTYIDVSITGLQNLPDTALLTLINITTGVVAMQPSNMIVIPLSPDSVGSGTFNKRFEIQSIRTGTFSVNVTLDLPENQPDHPPTQPQPGDHPPTQPQPQPRDSTTTVPQCPKCNCYCSATIIHVEEKDGVSTYRVSVTASCSGQFGPPPCKACGIVDAYEYEWQVSFSAGDGIEHVGSNKGSRFSFKNPKNAPFSLYINVLVRCSDGTKCSCTAVISSGPPTVPIGICPGCQCECSAAIIAINDKDEEREYTVNVSAVVTGKYDKPPCKDCKIIDTTYSWSIDSEDFAKITGGRTGKSVNLRTIKPGKYVLKVAVIFTCSDGNQCKCGDSKEGIVKLEQCTLTWVEMNKPLMSGDLVGDFFKKPKINRDDFILLKAKGEDVDIVKMICTKSKECIDDGSEQFYTITGMVKYDWEIKGEGNFVGIGCLPENKKAIGENVIFKPPYVPLPVDPATETIVSTEIILTIIDDDQGNFKDPDIQIQLTVITKRLSAEKDIYEISFEKTKPGTDPATEKTKNNIVKCKPDSTWSDVTPITEPKIILPPVNNNKQLLRGELIRLESIDQSDEDKLVVVCFSPSGCDPIRKYSAVFADRLEWDWKADKGKFAGTNGLTDNGRFVIYQAPTDIENETNVTITVTVRDDKSKYKDAILSSSITLTVYPEGVKLEYPDLNWLPDPAKPAEITSYLVYKSKEKNEWKEAFEHNCRIHFFELMNVSNEPGICLNAPPREKANRCPDLKIKNEDTQEVWAESKPEGCNDGEYYTKARTQKPLLKYKIKIHAEDYGARGFLRSMAHIYFVNKNGDAIIEEDKKPNYLSIPVQIADVKHQQADPSKKGDRAKKILYKDNRVNIPVDIDENNIPDNGWLIPFTTDDKGKIVNAKFPDYNVGNEIDTDDKPTGDKFHGDGLSLYEEYRGFMVKEEHRRTDPSKKDLFVNNDDGLPVESFIKATTIPVHQINSTQYSSLDQKYFDKNLKKTKHNRRFINFNHSIAHVTNQKGLWLTDETINDRDGHIILGETPSETDEDGDNITPAPPNWNLAVRVDQAKIIIECNKDPNDALVLNTKLPQVVAHELCHALNVYHHGEVSDGGLASGDINCIMRYDNMRLKNERPGTTLCTEVKGANNAKDRGKCYFQLHVSGRMQPNQTKGYSTKKN